MMLQLQGISAGYGGSPVIHDINLDVAEGEIVTLIGANGAGKSTLLKTISGLLRPLSGQVMLDGARIDTLAPAARVRRGIVHVPEGRQVFAGMSVRENLLLGAHATARGPARAARIGPSCARFPVLMQRLSDMVGNFSGGQQQMLAIARGLMAAPRLIMLDEPSLGLSPALVGDIFRLVRDLRADGLTVLLSEQNARASLSIADRGYVIENGRVTATDTARALLASPEIGRRYLGLGAGENAAPVDAALVERLRHLLADA